MSTELTQHHIQTNIVSIEHAILETLAYSDVFDYPLRIDGLHRYLPLPILRSDLTTILNNQIDPIMQIDGYYFLAGREHLITLRQHREVASRRALRRAFRYGRILGSLPFIRMVGLTGSLAVQNCNETADIDYLLVAAHGRVWLARAFALLFGRFVKLFGNTICPNLIFSEHNLEWQERDLYSARELCQMIPISGINVYECLRQTNSWTKSFLPNALSVPDSSPKEYPDPSQLQTILERPLRGVFGDRLEGWEMNRKIKRLTNQAGYGPETRFNRDICQGNFNQHGIQTKTAYQCRLTELGL